MKNWAYLICALCFLLTISTCAYADIEVRFFSVGDADAALIQCDGCFMLVDGGYASDSSRMYTILQQSNITHLDIVVASHVHEDHIGGIAGALNYATSDIILCPVDTSDEPAFASFAKYARLRGKGIKVPQVGDTYRLGNATIEILGVNSADGVNNSSIIMKLTYGKVTFLFTGDAEAEAEQVVASSGYDLSATVLKIAHHGSDTSSTYAFLENVMPTFAVISVDSDSKYGLPSENVLTRLQSIGSIVYRTDIHGNITFTSDGEKISTTIDAALLPFANKTGEFLYEIEQGVAYVVNISTMKFHLPTCTSVASIKDKNRADHNGTKEQLIDYGYQPCKMCHP